MGIVNYSFGQTVSNEDSIRQCYTDFMTRLMKEKFPIAPTLSISSESVTNLNYYIIPVVVHVIHQGGVENISDELIKSQIEVLNEDYGHYGANNNDPRGTDTKIRFCLAKKDPFGNPSTGINRVYSQYTNLIPDDELITKNLSIWNPKKYLNFWIVKTINGSSSIQAYSYLPSNSGGPAYSGDGIVVTYKYFGKGGNFSLLYNLGKTSSHESGHYFDLMHTWGRDIPGYGDCNDDDGIDDTPVCSLEYFSSPVTNCFHPVQCGNVRMIENYLDYSMDGCMDLFTPGQAKKMISTILHYRSELVGVQNMNDCGCRNIYDSLNNLIDIQLYPTLVTNDEIYLEIKNNFSLPLSFNIFDTYGRILYTKSYENIGTQTIKIAISSINAHLSPGVYIIRGNYGGSFQRKFIIPIPK